MPDDLEMLVIKQVLDVAPRTQLPQTGLMHIQGPRSDGIPAWQRDLGPLAPSDQGTQHAYRCPELSDRCKVRVVLGFVW